MKRSVRRRYKIALISIIASILTILIYLSENASFFARSMTTIIALLIFLSVDQYYKIHFDLRHYAYAIIIVTTGLLLSPLYFIYPNYDKIQHFALPILVSSMLLFMINKLPLKTKWKLVFVFFVTVGILGIHEIVEYSLDWAYDLKLQGVYLRDSAGLEKFNVVQEPLDDTMVDIILGILGSGIYSIIIAISRRNELSQRTNLFKKITLR